MLESAGTLHIRPLSTSERCRRGARDRARQGRLMDLLATVRRLGGAARIRDLRRAGATRYSVEKAIADGTLIRPRPGTVHLPAAAGLVALDSLVRTGRVTIEEVSGALPPRRPGPARWVIAHGDGASDSVFESLLRYHLLCNGVSDLVLQAPIPGLGRVDVLISGWLIVEADGFAFHSDPAAFAEDRRRTTVAAEQGYVTLRVGWRELRGGPAGVVRRIRAVWERGRLLDWPGRAAVGP